MRESLRIDSPFMGAGMPKAYSRDLRGSALSPAVETGASRREAAERFEVSVASAVKWLQRWYQQRSAAPKPRGGAFRRWKSSRSRFWILIAQRPDLTLVETVCRSCASDGSKPAAARLWRFLPTDTTSRSKKVLQAAERSSSEQMWRERAAAGYESKVCLILPGWCLSTRPPSARTW